jgi:signal recognition particle subunit SEC65
MDANSGKPWSKMDISDLRNEIAHGRTVAKTASFLRRDEDEVRETMKELGLVEPPRKEKPRRSEAG